MWGQQLAHDMLHEAGFPEVSVRRLESDPFNAYYIATRRESGRHMTGRHARPHAVVIGASVAGLLAARVLSEVYQRVTLLIEMSFGRTETLVEVCPKRGTRTCFSGADCRPSRSCSRHHW